MMVMISVMISRGLSCFVWCGDLVMLFLVWEGFVIRDCLVWLIVFL